MCIRDRCETIVDGKCAILEDETITINCSKIVKIGNQETITPLSGIKVTITGYDFDNVPTGFMWTGELSRKGTYDFVPSRAGKYLLEAMLPVANTVNSINPSSGKLWNPIIEVIENPNKPDNIITAAVVAPAAEEPAEPVVNASEGTELVEDPIDVFAPKCHTDMSILDFVMNVTETNKVRSDAPAIALMLVGFLIG